MDDDMTAIDIKRVCSDPTSSWRGRGQGVMWCFVFATLHAGLIEVLEWDMVQVFR